MISVVLLGTGNLASHLFNAFTASSLVTVAQVYGRNKEHLKPYAKKTEVTSSLDNLVAADVYILAVSDGAIPEISNALKNSKALVVHTSGATAMKVLVNKRCGVFYPLMTFTKGKALDFSKIPLCLEANSEEDLNYLEKLGNAISNSVSRISTDQRQTLHVAAVMSSNFSNHLYYIAEQLCKNDAIDFDILKPLLEETTAKINGIPPKEAQTGPAVRNDVTTMQKHLDRLTDKNHQKIYKLLSESIVNLYHKGEN